MILHGSAWHGEVHVNVCVQVMYVRTWFAGTGYAVITEVHPKGFSTSNGKHKIAVATAAVLAATRKRLGNSQGGFWLVLVHSGGGLTGLTGSDWSDGC
jgi:hypothetical protein